MYMSKVKVISKNELWLVLNMVGFFLFGYDCFKEKMVGVEGVRYIVEDLFLFVC